MIFCNPWHGAVRDFQRAGQVRGREPPCKQITHQVLPGKGVAVSNDNSHDSVFLWGDALGIIPYFSGVMQWGEGMFEGEGASGPLLPFEANPLCGRGCPTVSRATPPNFGKRPPGPVHPPVGVEAGRGAARGRGFRGPPSPSEKFAGAAGFGDARIRCF